MCLSRRCHSRTFLHNIYMRLQFDRESDESYREKRIQISGAVMRGSIAIEQHANKVYTRKMFEQFGENLFKGRAYQVEEIVKHIARHNDAEKCEKWRVVDYKVTMLDDGEWFECECGQFTHMGMVCCHALKVFLDLNIVHSSSIREKSYFDFQCFR
uniref:SWIM-type domain-containing protein n=1 Tax=Aegilops tauschii subsp. strangulata TaxID=200361 RepID=A0A453CFQ7_AEGTS